MTEGGVAATQRSQQNGDGVNACQFQSTTQLASLPVLLVAELYEAVQLQQGVIAATPVVD